jgi:hypothetical protein
VISAVGGFRAAVDRTPDSGVCAVAVVRGLVNDSACDVIAPAVWSSPGPAGTVAGASAKLVDCQVAAVNATSVLWHGSAGGPRAP